MSRDLTRRSSRIARNVKNFETWATYQGCEQVAYSDVPKDLRDDVTKVFTVDGFLPASWASKVTPPADSLPVVLSLTGACRTAASAWRIGGISQIPQEGPQVVSEPFLQKRIFRNRREPRAARRPPGRVQSVAASSFYARDWREGVGGRLRRERVSRSIHLFWYQVNHTQDPDNICSYEVFRSPALSTSSYRYCHIVIG